MIRGKRTVALTALVILAAAAIGIRAEQAAARKSLMVPAGLTETAPATYNVKFDTNIGEFVVRVTRSWAPNGADRFYNLVKNGFFDEARFFRVMSNFMVQFGLHADPAVSTVWRNARIPPDKVTQSNSRASSPLRWRARPTPGRRRCSSTSALTSDSTHMGFAPFGQVVCGWSWWTRSTRVTAKARRAAGPGRARRRRRQRVSHQVVPEPRLHQNGDDPAVGVVALVRGSAVANAGHGRHVVPPRPHPHHAPRERPPRRRRGAHGARLLGRGHPARPRRRRAARGDGGVARPRRALAHQGARGAPGARRPDAGHRLLLGRHRPGRHPRRGGRGHPGVQRAARLHPQRRRADDGRRHRAGPPPGRQEQRAAPAPLGQVAGRRARGARPHHRHRRLRPHRPAGRPAGRGVRHAGALPRHREEAGRSGWPGRSPTSTACSRRRTSSRCTCRRRRARSA